MQIASEVGYDLEAAFNRYFKVPLRKYTSALPAELA